MTIRRKPGHMDKVRRPTARTNRAIVQQNLERLKQITIRPQGNPPATPEAQPTASGRQQQNVPVAGEVQPQPLQKEESETPEHMLREAGEQAIDRRHGTTYYRKWRAVQNQITNSYTIEIPHHAAEHQMM